MSWPINRDVKLLASFRGYLYSKFHFGRYIVGYTVRNLALRRRASGAVKRDFWSYIRRYTSPNENFGYGYPHSNALLLFPLKLERCNLHKAARQPTICDVINDVNNFRRYIAGYTVANFWRYPMRRRVTKSSALEFMILLKYEFPSCSSIYIMFVVYS